jgi:hypothetical protein
MPAIAHIGVGFAAKKAAPGISVIYLIIAAELIEIAFFGFVAAGIESMPMPEKPPFSPYSHGVFSGIIWSLAAGLFAWLISKNKKTCIIIGLLVLSHTILDIIASPKLAFYPTDTKVPVFFDNSLSVGLGLFKNKILSLVIEFGVLLFGILIYVMNRKSGMQHLTIT